MSQLTLEDLRRAKEQMDKIMAAAPKSPSVGAIGTDIGIISYRGDWNFDRMKLTELRMVEGKLDATEAEMLAAIRCSIERSQDSGDWRKKGAE